MSPILLPTASDVLRCIRETVQSTIMATLPGHAERSAATTICHLLRYVERRIECEGQSLLDEERKLQGILRAAAVHLDARGDELGRTLAGAIHRSLETADPAIYPSLTLMAERVALLREHAGSVLAALQPQQAIERGTEGDAIRQSLREYITWQIAEEGKLVESSFAGHGPRR